MNNSAVKQKEYRILIRGEGAQYFHVANETESFMVRYDKVYNYVHLRINMPFCI